MPRSPGTVDALAGGTPLQALHAHSALLRDARGTASGEASLRACLRRGDRLARGLAIRPLARIAGATSTRRWPPSREATTA